MFTFLFETLVLILSKNDKVDSNDMIYCFVHICFTNILYNDGYGTYIVFLIRSLQCVASDHVGDFQI